MPTTAEQPVAQIDDVHSAVRKPTGPYDAVTGSMPITHTTFFRKR